MMYLFKAFWVSVIVASAMLGGGCAEERPSAVTSSGNVFVITMKLVDPDNLCLDVNVKTTKGFEGYIERWGLVYRGEAVLPRFDVLSPTGEKYQYIGPIDTRKMADDEDFMYVSSSHTYVDRLCLRSIFDITDEVDVIQFLGAENLKSKNENSVIMTNYDMKLSERHEINVFVN